MRFSKRTKITFEQMILLYKSYLDYINERIDANFTAASEQCKQLYKFTGIEFAYDKWDKFIGFFINYKDAAANINLSEYHRHEDCTDFGCDRYYSETIQKMTYRSNHKAISLFYELANFHNYDFTIKDGKFFIKLNILTNLENSLDNQYASIKVTNKETGEVEEFYYNYRERSVSKKIGKNVLILSETIRNRVLESFPSFDYRRLPNELKDYIKTRKWDVDLEPLHDEGKNNASQSFMTTIMSNPNAEIGSADVSESIKVNLTKLKESKYDPNRMFQKIRIPSKLFFSSIEENKKVIDPFFNDSDIIKYCDLSQVDFTNAVIKNVTLANSNANIDLSRVYDGDITNADLENVNLLGQELNNGIKADYANFRGTRVFVLIGGASIIGAKFDSNCHFRIDGAKKWADIELVKAMGIDVAMVDETVTPMYNKK